MRKGADNLKRLLIILLTLTIFVLIALTACNSEDEIEEMGMLDKIWYSNFLGFEVVAYGDGGWHYVDGRSRRINMVLPDNADSYTEVRIVRPSEVIVTETTVIFAFPNEETVADVVNMLNWEVDSVGIDLSDFTLTYPVTATDLVDNYESVNRLIRHGDGWLGAIIADIIPYYPARTSRVEFELSRILQVGYAERVYGILERLNISPDEAGPILRAAGSVDAFETVVELMFEEGLSSDDALRRVARGR